MYATLSLIDKDIHGELVQLTLRTVKYLSKYGGSLHGEVDFTYYKKHLLFETVDKVGESRPKPMRHECVT